MEYAEELCKEPVEVPDELFARLREHFDEAQIVELTAAIAIENFRARFNNALDIAPAGFSEGMFCPAAGRGRGAAAVSRRRARPRSRSAPGARATVPPSHRGAIAARAASASLGRRRTARTRSAPSR